MRPVTGAAVTQLPVDDHREWWAGRNGCSGWSDRPVPDRADDGTTVVERRGQDCGAPTLFYRVEGGGHTWPGMRVDFAPSLGPLSRDPDATATFADSFVGG